VNAARSRKVWYRLALAVLLAGVGALKVLAPARDSWIPESGARVLGVLEFVVACLLCSGQGVRLISAVLVIASAVGMVFVFFTDTQCCCLGRLETSRTAHAGLAALLGWLATGTYATHGRVRTDEDP
jgi:hypothetical protein